MRKYDPDYSKAWYANSDKSQKKEYRKKWYEDNKDRIRTKTRSNKLKRKYGITQEQFEQMLVDQDNKCAICGAAEPGAPGAFRVDHCHKNGNVRGLLCHMCNAGLGYFKDNVENLREALFYLFLSAESVKNGQS